MEKNKLELHTKEVQNIIYTYAPAEEGFQKTIFTAMNYSFQAGGKRLRPLLMQETYRLFGGTGKVVEPFMAAIEMIHTYSLIHDDLPALDNDEYRRGRKTSHVVFGEAMAILAGDALLNYAFETACKAFELKPGNQTVARAFTILAKKAGVNNYAKFNDYGYKGLYGGETAKDIAKRKGIDPDKEEILDHMGSNVLAANLFRITQTDEVIKNNNITGEKNACNTHHMVGQAIRNTIIKVGGTTPEKLPTPKKSIKEIEKEESKKIESK